MLTALAIAPVLALFALGCSRTPPAPSVVLYVSADEYVAREVIAAFEARHAIQVEVVTDTEATKTTGLVQRLRAEADNPRSDVFWSSEIFQTIELAEEGVLVEHVSDVTADWPRDFRDGRRRWFGFGSRARVIVYNTERVTPEEVPDSWLDLTAPRWKDRLVMADPRFGTTGGHLAAMMAFWEGQLGRGYYESYLLSLAKNGMRFLPSGNAGVVEAVALGEADVGMTDTDDVWAAQARGLKVDLVYPSHVPTGVGRGVGTLLIPNTVGRVKGGPNPDRAAVLIDFLLSEEVERILAESVSHNIPVRESLATEYADYAVEHTLRVDYEAVAALRSDAVDMAVEVFERIAADPESG